MLLQGQDHPLLPVFHPARQTCAGFVAGPLYLIRYGGLGWLVLRDDQRRLLPVDHRTEGLIQHRLRETQP